LANLFSPILNRYTNFTMTGDGLPEINSLTLLPFESEFPEPEAGQRLALVLIESRLLEPRGDPALLPALMQKLRRHKTDLRAEGLVGRFISASVYRGPVQKDGQTVLALRKFLQDVRAVFAKLEGVTLVGNFPESTLVRTFDWAPQPTLLVIGPELISERADIVLGDLTGNWDQLYRRDDFAIDKTQAHPDAETDARGWRNGEWINDVEFTSTGAVSLENYSFRDAFLMDDSMSKIQERKVNSFHVQLRGSERNNEVDPLDRTRTNIIARPDIAVARLNALHVAVNPDPNLVGANGEHFLDVNGDPQVVTAPTPLFDGEPYKALFTFRDPDLERHLLLDYFDRNHRFRTGAFSHLDFRTAAISGSPDFNPQGYANMMSGAAADFGPAVIKPNASLREYVDFLKTPAVLKYVMAHSNPLISEFRDENDAAALTNAVGGTPVRWVYQSGRYSPSFDAWSGNAELSLHRSLWHRKTLQSAGASLVIHGGCNVNSVYETQTQTYTSPTYAHWNNAEAFLLYTNCVALMTRAKGFNDAPDGFADGFRVSERANFGSCWQAYFNAQSADSGLTRYNVQRKRAYFWSILGDWSVRLRYRNGLGLIGVNNGLSSVAVHPNRAWIDAWNFDAGVNKVRNIGDLDGDGADEFVVTSDWGIGVLRHDGLSYRTLMQAPRDTWFGQWRWDATVNQGRDRIKAVANFTDTAKQQILVWSNWGIATLGYAGGTMTPTRIHSNGTRFGGWLLGTNDNVYAGHGRFNAGGLQQMVVTSPWGLGIIGLDSGTALFMAQNGTRLGDWLLGTDNNRIRLIADLDGDGVDEIVITSPWGLGVLKMLNGKLQSIAQHPNGDNLHGYVLNIGHNFALADRLTGTARHQVVVTSDSGFHVLELAGNRLNRIAFAANGSRIDGWLVGTQSDNQLLALGDVTGDGRADMAVRSPWGIGVLTLGTDSNLHLRTSAPYGTALGDWHLEPGDFIEGSAKTAASPNRVLVFTKP